MPSMTPDPEPVTPPEGRPAASRVVNFGPAVGIIGFSDDDDFNWGIFLLALLLAFGVHAVFGVGANRAPQKKMSERIEMAVYVPPPPPSNDTPPETPQEPVPIVTGINLNSVVQGSGGPTVRVGNTTYGDPNSEKFVAPSDVKAYAGGQPGFKAAKSSSITREIEVVCRSRPRFPKELADQGIEGVTELLLKVSSTGELIEARVARTSGHKPLDDLSRQGIRNCSFKPGEVNGESVDSILRYRFRWELYD